MKNAFSAGAALLLSTTALHAGGLDRTGGTVGIIFEEGNRANLSYGYVMPDVSGTFNPGVELSSGNVGEDYSQFGFGLKYDIDARASIAFIYDQPYGANVNYGSTDAGYPISGSNAEFRSTSLGLIGRYKFTENYSIHYGLRAVTIDADATVFFAGAPAPYEATYDEDTQTQIILGAAYERPDIALRVALTYASEMEFDHETSVVGVPDGFADNTTYTIPKSVTLDFQSGVAADTLVFGSVRWSEWSETQIDSFAYPSNPIVGFDDDVYTYTLGVGRRINDQLAVSASVSYEEASDGFSSNLAPTNGSTAISLGAAYDIGNGIEISGGVRYVMVGDAETQLGPLTTDFSDNSAVAVGVEIGYTF